MILPWTGCATRRSTRTTTVLSVLSETTVPVRTRLGMCSSSSLGLGGARPFVLQRLDLRDGAADLADAARLFKLVSQIGRAACRKECVSTCRVRWSTEH